MKKKDSVVTCIVFALLLFVPAVLFLVLPKQTYSETERRVLANAPEVSMESISDGTFMEETEDWLSDHFPGRNAFVGLYGIYSEAVGRRDIGGAYLASGGYKITKLTDSEELDRQITENLESISEFIETVETEGTPVSLLLAPSASLSLSDRLPAFAPVYSQGNYLDLAEELLGNHITDLRKVLTEDSDYYKTDHHWTTEGAFKAYEAWVKSRNERITEAASETSEETAKVSSLKELSVNYRRRYKEVTVSERFRGTGYAKVLCGLAKDTVTAYEDGKTYRVIADGKELPGLYDTDKLNSVSDAYDYFFGGNYAVMTVSEETEETHEGGNLLVIKDSYANCFLPFAVGSYDSVHVIDLRYANLSVKEYIAENHITEVLILYGMDGFAEDRNITKLTVGLSEDVSELRYRPRHAGTEPDTVEILKNVLETVSDNGMDECYGYGDSIFMENFQTLYAIEPGNDAIGDAAIAYGNGNANEISILYVYDTDKVSAVKYALNERLKNRLRDFEGYMPEEVYKLEAASVKTDGHYVYLVIGDKAEEITEALQKALENQK